VRIRESVVIGVWAEAVAEKNKKTPNKKPALFFITLLRSFAGLIILKIKTC
jgi:hypothetical protein